MPCRHASGGNQGFMRFQQNRRTWAGIRCVVLESVGKRWSHGTGVAHGGLEELAAGYSPTGFKVDEGGEVWEKPHLTPNKLQLRCGMGHNLPFLLQNDRPPTRWHVGPVVRQRKRPRPTRWPFCRGHGSTFEIREMIW